MDDMRHVAERLVIRCQEALLQLELSIQRKMCEFDPNSSHCFKQVQEYYSYLARLTSLKLRSDHVHGNLLHCEKDLNDTFLEHETLERLIFEFQEITVGLNELAKSHHSPAKSACSNSSHASSSIPLKALKIIERNRESLIADTLQMIPQSTDLEENEVPGRSTPTKKAVKFTEEDSEPVTQLEDLKRTSSLPGSPIPETMLENDLRLTTSKVLRLAKSYDVGLNTKKRNDSTWDFFKNKNRVSLSVFDEADSYGTDDETVISLSPPKGCLSTDDICFSKQYRPHGRCNSHESIFSRKVVDSHPVQLKMVPNIPSNWQNRSITTKPTVGMNSFQTTASTANYYPRSSKDVLSHIIEPLPEKKSNNWFQRSKSYAKGSTIVQRWFTSDALVTTEVGTPTTSNGTNGRPIIENKSPHTAFAGHTSSIVIGPNGTKFVRGLNDPLITYKVSVGELQEALNTEFRF